jgi:hypothetical protein
MSTCPPNLTHSFLTVCKIIRFKVGKNKLIFLCSRGVAKLLVGVGKGVKKSIFLSRYGLKDFKF